MRSAAGIVCAVMCFLLCSCSDVEPLQRSNATLSGKITYRGKPVPHAMVIVASQTESATTNADEQGNYKVDHAPTGAVKIAVNTAAARGAMMGKMMAAKQKPPTGGQAAAVAAPDLVDLPEKYFDPSTSGITTNVADGPNTYDIVIE